MTKPIREIPSEVDDNPSSIWLLAAIGRLAARPRPRLRLRLRTTDVATDHQQIDRLALDALRLAGLDPRPY